MHTLLTTHRSLSAGGDKKDDIHSVPIGTTITNQTGDVIGFATGSDPCPCNAPMGFDDHNWTSLIHSPDRQAKPGW